MGPRVAAGTGARCRRRPAQFRRSQPVFRPLFRRDERRGPALQLDRARGPGSRANRRPGRSNRLTQGCPAGRVHCPTVQPDRVEQRQAGENPQRRTGECTRRYRVRGVRWFDSRHPGRVERAMGLTSRCQRGSVPGRGQTGRHADREARQSCGGGDQLARRADGEARGTGRGRAVGRRG